MSRHLAYDRRQFLTAAVAGVVAAGSAKSSRAFAFDARTMRGAAPTLRRVKTVALDVAYQESGPPDGIPVVLLHGFPYSTASFATVAERLAVRGCRVIVPDLRGHGGTRFLAANTPRSGQQAALGSDVLELLDALGIARAVLAGFDWGARAACVAAALFPSRVAALVSVNGYLIQDIAAAAVPMSPSVESGLWYQFYFTTARGRAGLQANRRALAQTLWRRNSPTWVVSDAALAMHAAAFENPDYVDVVIHSYRHRLGLADGYASYAGLERQLTALPPIPVPTITMDGNADGVVQATDGSAQAKHFTGVRWHRVVNGVGHNLPQEAPDDFAAAVWHVASAYR